MHEVKAFRCKNCGYLENCDHAAEHHHPHACRVCGSGVVFRHRELADQVQAAIDADDLPKAKVLLGELKGCDPASKRLDSDNWEVLAEATPERLKELGLTTEDVEQHTPWTKDESQRRAAIAISVTAGDGVGGTDQGRGTKT